MLPFVCVIVLLLRLRFPFSVRKAADGRPLAVCNLKQSFRRLNRTLLESHTRKPHASLRKRLLSVRSQRSHAASQQRPRSNVIMFE